MATIFSCEHPVRVYNKFLHRYLVVPCRKCPSCKAKKMSEWTDKLNRESECHPYSFFGTLTYAPEFLPFYHVDFEKQMFISKDGSCFFEFNELNDYLDYDSIRYIKFCGNSLPCVDLSHAQRFFKRLRSRISKNPSGEPANVRYVRYFCCSEYGETKLRPHYHFILFTASSWFANNAKRIVAECWQDDFRHKESQSLGVVDCQPVRTSCSGYVSSYVTCVDNLPKIYTFRGFRPAFICSKHPPLGSLLGSSEEIRKLFDSGSVKRTVHREDGKFLEFILPKNLSDRLYPRLSGFSQFPLNLLNSVYAKSDDYLQMSFNDFSFYVNLEVDKKSYLGSYFVELINRDLNSVDQSALRNCLSVLKRFALQRQLLNVSINEYFNRIVDFWKRRDYELLKLQCRWQVDFADDLNRRKKYPDFYSYLDLLQFDVDNLDFSFDEEFTSKVSNFHKVVSDGKMKHFKNDYLIRDKINSDFKNFLFYLKEKRYECK